jgi:pimeloyl-ACP methyl ester carboxylesterase
VVQPLGQRGSFIEMRYLAEHVPTLLVWTEQDVVIPVAHAHLTHAHLPGSQMVVFPGGGHEPHRRHAPAFADAVAAFITAT